MRLRKVALITGASRGIGRELARALVGENYRVYLAARSGEALHALASELNAQRPDVARAVVMDVSQCEETVHLIRSLDDECGGFDLIVANAGVGASSTDSRIAWESMAAALHTNFCGAAATLTAVLPRMVERGRGHLVGISSLASYGALPLSSAYCSPKAGLSMLLDCLRMDVERTGVAVTEVKLGFVRTAAVQGVTHPLPQLMEPEEAAARIVRLLPRRPARIVRPRLLGGLARWGARLPRPVRHSLLWRRREP